MKSLLLLWQKVANESATWCCTSATMDCKTVLGRVEHEGLSFLTITLPQFGKDFEKSLDQGVVDRRSFTGFQWKRGLPRFLGGFLDRVFDRTSGVLLDSPCIDAIIAIRQLTLMYSKIELPCSDTRVRDALRGWVECEQHVREADSQRTPIDIEAFRRMSALLYRKELTIVDRKIYDGDELFPQHGPGSTADGLIGNNKFLQSTWPARLEKYFPMGEMLLPNWSYYNQLEEIDMLEPGSEIPVKVITVPKTLKTPRIIGMEPTAMMYAQKAISPLIREALKGSRKRGSDYLSSFLGFDDQTPNQRMAEEGSLLQGLATLDLSEASDRVSNQLVREMFRDHPHLHGAVDACRSRKADVDGHGVIRMAKFACMGSDLCFPIEAMVFLTIIFLGIEKDLNTSLCPRILKEYVGRVRVYGDDIIVPVEHVRSVVSMLEHFGAQVNTAKSFWTGRFRESCGKEYFAGHDVSIVKFRQEFPTHRMNATGVISLISFRNQMYFSGYWGTVKWLDDAIRKIIRYFPVVEPSSPVQGRHSFLSYEPERMCKQLHRPLVRGYVVNAKSPINRLDGSGALLKILLNTRNRELGVLPDADKEHLERSGRPQAVNIKLRWSIPF
jgi:hypothetical protein